MIYKSISLPVFIEIGKGSLNQLREIISEWNLIFNKVAIITGNYGEKLVTEKRIKSHFSKTGLFNIRKCKDLSQLRSNIVLQGFELILGIGGGSVNDISKYISMQTSIPFIYIPTVLSNDGIASPISIIKTDRNYRSLGTTLPTGIIADLDVLTKSPRIFLLSGLGDVISNLSACLDWDLASKETGEKIDILAKSLSVSSAINMIYGSLRGKYDNISSERFIKDLFNNLLTSATAMIIAKSSRPASGAEHSISHALDKLGVYRPHGIQVGFATLFTLFLHRQNDLLEDVIAVYRQLKFPISLSDLHIDEEYFIKAIQMAPSIRKRFTILNKFSSESLVLEFKEFKRVVIAP